MDTVKNDERAPLDEANGTDENEEVGQYVDYSWFFRENAISDETENYRGFKRGRREEYEENVPDEFGDMEEESENEWAGADSETDDFVEAEAAEERSIKPEERAETTEEKADEEDARKVEKVKLAKKIFDGAATEAGGFLAKCGATGDRVISAMRETDRYSQALVVCKELSSGKPGGETIVYIVESARYDSIVAGRATMEELKTVVRSALNSVPSAIKEILRESGGKEAAQAIYIKLQEAFLTIYPDSIGDYEAMTGPVRKVLK